MRPRRDDPAPFSDPLEGDHAAVRAATREAVANARAENKARRARVLAHPDLAEALKRALSLSSAEHWNGFVPPRADQEDACRACAQCRCKARCHCCRIDHFAKINGSPIRAALVEICAEARAREDAAVEAAS